MIKLPVEGGFAKPPKTRHNSKENRNIGEDEISFATAKQSEKR